MRLAHVHSIEISIVIHNGVFSSTTTASPLFALFFSALKYTVAVFQCLEDLDFDFSVELFNKCAGVSKKIVGIRN